MAIAFELRYNSNIIAEGIEFSDKTVAIRWCNKVKSTEIWNSLKDLQKVHPTMEFVQYKLSRIE